MSNELKQTVDKLKYLLDCGVEEIAKSIDYSRVHLTKQMKKDSNDEITNGLNNLLLEKHRDTLQNVKLNIKQSKPTNKNNLPSNNMLDKAIETVNTLAESNKLAIQTNADLAAMLKAAMGGVPTENAGSETLKAFDAKLDAVLEAVAEVGSGKRYHSPEEARAAIGRRYFEKLQFEVK